MFSVRKDFMVMTILLPIYFLLCYSLRENLHFCSLPNLAVDQNFFWLCLEIIGQFKNRLHLRGINDQNLLKTEEDLQSCRLVTNFRFLEF